MIGNFERCLAITLQWEGGVSNDAADPGRLTKWGITHANYDAWRVSKRLPTQSVRAMTLDECKAIYRRDYWDAMSCDTLPPGYDLCVFDAAVNSGTGRARTWRAGYPTIDAFQAARLSFLQHLGHLWRVFGRGWGRRVTGIKAQAHAMEPKAVNDNARTMIGIAA